LKRSGLNGQISITFANRALLLSDAAEDQVREAYKEQLVQRVEIIDCEL